MMARAFAKSAPAAARPAGAACRCALRSPGPSNRALQAKLTVGPANDPLERAADRAADRVVAGGPAGALGRVGLGAQRACAACAAEDREIMRRQVAEKEEQEEEGVQAKAEVGGLHAAGAEAAAAAVASGGQPLSTGLRAYFEPRFGHGFSNVRVHDHVRAGVAARAIGARAYTLGRDIAFAPGAWAPASEGGRRLIAHELAHVVQQGSGRETPSATIRRDDGAGPAPGPAPAPAPAPAQPQNYGAPCSGGTDDPCQYARCGDRHATILDDLTRAIGYVQDAIRALGTTPLARDTSRALDWYFNDTSSATVSTARERLVCVRDCLQSTWVTNEYGCNPDRTGALAYVCTASPAPCSQDVTPICLTNSHFGNSDRRRAQTMIHECAHRVGMSLGAPESVDDIYQHTTRFLFLDTEEALLNSDSYALFAGAISGGVPVSFVIVEPSIGAGVAIPGRGAATWQARLYIGAEVQHPVLGIFNPTLGFGMSLIGETTTGGPSPVEAGPSLLASLLAGVRIGDPRPGAAGGGYASFFGGPALAVGASELKAGAEAGLALGYRWRWLDVSAGVGYAYDPTREAGMEHLFTLGASVSFLPFHVTAGGR